MTDIEIPQPNSRLPATTPDLVLAVGPGEQWRILQLAPRLAALLGTTPTRFAELERRMTPSLRELGREVLASGQPLRGIALGIDAPEPLRLDADIEPGGLSADFRSQLLYLQVHPPRAPRAPEEAAQHGIIGSSPALRELYRKLKLYAASDAAVVITGETGTGKELAAQALHQLSPRADGPFIALNCSAISEELLESELFGHEKGAFTGALRSHRGRFERADGGSLFLDEIGEMPLHTQAKLLRVLEAGSIERVGSEQPRAIDVRVVCATNVPLEQAVGQGRFRADLYHRLSVLRLHLPPLRERREDLPALVEHFLAQFRRKYRRAIARLTPEAMALLDAYLWPGNIRELRNVLERVFVETQAELIGARAFGDWIRERQDFAAGDWGIGSAASAAPPLAPPYPLPGGHPQLAAPSQQTLEAELLPSRPRRSTRPAELDAAEIRRAYHAADGNLSAAARLLGVHRATLYRYLDKLGLSRHDLAD